MAGTPEQHIFILRNKLQDCTKACEDESLKKEEFKTANEQLTAEIRRQKDAYAKLEKHNKDCEKAVTKAQKDVKHTKGYADHLINSQKGHLKSAERRYEDAARDLKEWRDKYGWSVEKPAEEKYALQVSLSEWQSKAESAQNEIASLEEQIQGTPKQIGLHQALEEWEEHQGCSAEVADLQDKVHDGMLLKQKLESDLTASRQRCQRAKSDVKALQTKVNQLQQANKTFQELQVSPDQLEQAEKAFQELRIKADQLEQDKKALQDQDKTHDYILYIQKLEFDLKASAAARQKTEWDNKVLQDGVYQLEQAKDALRDQAKTDVDMLDKEKLESDLKTAKEQRQTTESDMETLQREADQLESDLQTEQKQHRITKSNMEVLQGKADQMEADLGTAKEQYQTTKSNIEALQGEKNRLEVDLETAKEQHRTTKSNMETLQGEKDQLKQANEAFHKKENERLQTKTSEKKEQGKKGDSEVADAVQRGIEERMKLIAQQNSWKEPEQDNKTQQLRIEAPKEADRSQVTPPSSPIYTTDEGSQDLEKTPRPKKSLRQDLGYSSRDQSDEGQSEFCMPQQQRTMMSKQAGAEIWETNDSEDAEEHNEGLMRRKMKKLLPSERQAKNVKTLEIRAKERAKEQSEAIETLFECTPAKANAIDRRLKALGPGCRLHEAPALVAHELSGIPEDTYKGLASGQLIATMPPNEVKDVGTNPDVFACDMATDTTGLPAEEVAGPLFFAQDIATDTTELPSEEVAGPLFFAKDMATDTTDLLVAQSTVPHTRSNRRVLFSYFLMSMMIFFGFFCLYMGLEPDLTPKTQNRIMYKNIYSHRHTPFPTPSLSASTPVTFVYPPMPAPQLGLARMMKGSSLGEGLNGRTW